MPAEKTAPAVFVTGTDTGVGKTLVAAALARHFSGKGLTVGVMKPIETGVPNPAQAGPDAALLRWAAQAKDADELLSPFRFELPASPHQAAAEAAAQVDAQTIVDAFNTLRQGRDLLLVEGAGGLMVPIRGGYLMADLAMQLGAPLLVVTRPGLGTLNHTLLTTFAARTMDLPMSGFIINRMPVEPNRIEAESPHLLASMASADLLGVLPEVAGSCDEEKVEQLARQIDQLPTYQWLRQKLALPL